MTTTEENKEIVRREFKTVWQERNLDDVDQLFAAEIQVGTERAGSDETLIDVDDLKALVQEWLDAFPDATMEINAMVAEDDRVMAHWTMHGTHQGSFRGIEATGNDVTVEGFSSRRLHNGEIVETKSAADMVDLLDQLDAEIPLDT